MAVAPSAHAEVYPESGDRVVIGDMTYVLVRAGDWASVTQQVATCMAVYDKMNGTEEGRVAIHGRRGHTTITNGEITVEYKDGYKRTEKIAANATPRRTSVTRGGVTMPTSPAAFKPTVPERLERIRARRMAARTHTNEVTVTVGPNDSKRTTARVGGVK